MGSESGGSTSGDWYCTGTDYTRTNTGADTAIVGYDTTLHVISVVCTANEVKTYTDGTLTAFTVFTPTVSVVRTGLCLGGLQAVTSGLTGVISEAVIYDGVVNDTDHNIVGNYLQWKWATPAWTPVEEFTP